MYSVVCTVLCAVFHFRFVVFNLKFAVGKVQCVLRSVHHANFFVKRQMYSVLCAACSAVYSALGSSSVPVYNVQCAVFSVLQYI